MSKTSKSCWTNFERTAAKDGGSFRVPLSGMNSRHCAGDVIIPADVDVLVECKLRAKFAHHALFRAAETDSLKTNKKHTLLYTRQKHERGHLVTVSGETWSAILGLPG